MQICATFKLETSFLNERLKLEADTIYEMNDVALRNKLLEMFAI